MSSPCETATGQRESRAKFDAGQRVLLLYGGALFGGSVVQVTRTKEQGGPCYAVRVPALGRECELHERDLHPDDGATPAVRAPEQLAAQRVLNVLKSRDCRALPRPIRRQIEDILRREISEKFSTDPQAAG